jgi:hypothetical protein
MIIVNMIVNYYFIIYPGIGCNILIRTLSDPLLLVQMSKDHSFLLSLIYRGHQKRNL